jgi:hypothetical protein
VVETLGRVPPMSQPPHVPLIPPPIQIPDDMPADKPADKPADPPRNHVIHIPLPLPLPILPTPSTNHDFPVLHYEYERCLFCSILLRPSRVSSDPHVCISCLFFATTFGYQEPLHCDICCRPAWRIHTFCRTVLCRWCLPHWLRCPKCRLPIEE